MRLLIDTHLLVWAADDPDRLSQSATELLVDAGNDLLFSVVSVWELVIKIGLGRNGLRGNPNHLRRGLIDNGYRELTVLAPHVLAVAGLPPLHGDPFDRLLIAQARVEGLTLLTADAAIGRYPGAIMKV